MISPLQFSERFPCQRVLIYHEMAYGYNLVPILRYSEKDFSIIYMRWLLVVFVSLPIDGEHQMKAINLNTRLSDSN